MSSVHPQGYAYEIVLLDKGLDWIVTMTLRAMMEWILMIVFRAYSQSPLFPRTMVASTKFFFPKEL